MGAKSEIAGAVPMVVAKEELLHLESTDLADLATKRPMMPETFFGIASMSKPVTGTAILMLQDEGKLDVADPVAKYLPGFAYLKASSRTKEYSAPMTETTNGREAVHIRSRACFVAPMLYPPAMSTILESDETGTLHLPPSLLPQPGPHRRYRVAAENGQVIVGEAPTATAKPWMELAGCFKDEAEELRRIDRIIADEFERVDPENWR